MLSYAGIHLTVPTQDQQESIQAWMDSFTEFEFNNVTWPGKELEGVTFAQHDWPPSQPRLGTLYWPFTAMKWGVGHFVCSGEQLELIRLALPPFSSESPPQPAPLVMSTGDGFHTIETNLFLLPPRPIHQIDGSNQFYLLTLVDERYHWWFADSGDFHIVDGTTWDNLYNDLAAVLGIDLSFDEISANYFFPDPAFTNYYQDVPVLLDAVAYNVGQRIIRFLDGTVQAVNNTSSLANLNANILAVNNQGSKILGGVFQRVRDFAYAMPTEVHNVTPVWESDVPSVLDPLFHVETRQLTSEAFGAVVGFDGIKTFRDTFHGTEDGLFANEALLAAEVATDYWLRIYNAFVDVVLAHALNVIPDGLHDIEWTYEIERPTTRIKRPSWNWEADTLLHGDGNGPFYGNSVNEPWQVQPFFAMISSPTGTAYPWTEVIPATGGTWGAKPSGRSGTDSLNPAYEFNASTDATPGSIVLMWRGFQNAASTKQEWLFAVMGGGGGGSLTFEETDGSPICAGISVVKVDSDTMYLDCSGPGEATIGALLGEDIYVLYQNNTLKSVPCANGSIATPPYSNGVIATWKTQPGLDFQNDTHSLYTNPTTGGGNGTVTNCTPSAPPADGFYCHQNPGGNSCSNSSYFVANDTAVLGPYGNISACNDACANGSNSPYHFYSENPGINWIISQGNSSGDTGPCTAVLKASVTYPPPNQSQLVNGYIPGQGTMYPLNLIDSCTMTWLVVVDAVCATINISANWNGLLVYGSTSCPYPDCSASPDLIGHANALIFDPCDLKAVDVGSSCDPLRAIKVGTCGGTQTISGSYLKPDCSTGTLTLVFKDGLFKEGSMG